MANCGGFENEQDCVGIVPNYTGCKWTNNACTCDTNMSEEKDGKCYRLPSYAKVTFDCGQFNDDDFNCPQHGQCHYDTETGSCTCKATGDAKCYQCVEQYTMEKDGRCVCQNGYGYELAQNSCFPCGYGGYSRYSGDSTHFAQCARCETYTDSQHTVCYESCEGDHKTRDNMVCACVNRFTQIPDEDGETFQCICEPGSGAVPRYPTEDGLHCVPCDETEGFVVRDGHCDCQPGLILVADGERVSCQHSTTAVGGIAWGAAAAACVVLLFITALSVGLVALRRQRAQRGKADGEMQAIVKADELAAQGMPQGFSD